MKTAVIRLSRTLFFIHRSFVHGPFTYLPSDARGIFPFFIYPSMHFNPTCFATRGEGKTRVVLTLSDRKNRGGREEKKREKRKKEKARGQGFLPGQRMLNSCVFNDGGKGRRDGGWMALVAL